MKNRAVFLDRDGVINRKAPEGEYIERWDERLILPGVGDAITKLNAAGYRVFVVTNQRGIARGKVSLSDLNQIHERLIDRLAQSGAIIERIYYCPHGLDEACECRKPEPGMLRRAVAEYHVEPAISWMVGDSPADVLAGQKAGCRTVLIREGVNHAQDGQADVVAANLVQAVESILQLDGLSPLNSNS
jgi:D-glycero-D-manno-heptose 1,7-bisphosphate phosphatase